MYILANGVKITEKGHQKLCQAIKDSSQKREYFLDMKTGELIKVPHAWHKKLAVMQKERQRYIPLPKVSEKERRERFIEFMKMWSVDSFEKEKLLQKEIRRGASISKLEKILEKDSSGWIHGWVQDEQFLLAEHIEDWITEPPLLAKDDLDYWYDDDCPTCQFLKKMEEENQTPTLSETHKTFKKAKDQGAWVGGDLFEKYEDNKREVPDEDIEKILELVKSGKFEPGIYNFCDRWCEKCKDTERCLLFAQEKQRKNRKSVESENHDKNLLNEAKYNLKLTRRLLQYDLQKQGLDLEKILEEEKKLEYWDDNVDERYDKNECLILARQYMKEVHKFLEDFHQNCFQFYSELGMEVDISDIKNEIDIVIWYYTMLPVKIWRFLYEKESFEREKDKELKELMAKDLDKYYALVKKCIDRSKVAWRDLSKERKELSSISLHFIDILNNIEGDFCGLRKPIDRKIY
jgi:hypothetical protein